MAERFSERIHSKPRDPVPHFFREHGVRNHVFRLGTANTEEERQIMSAHNQVHAAHDIEKLRRQSLLRLAAEAKTEAEKAVLESDLAGAEEQLYEKGVSVQQDHEFILPVELQPQNID